MYHSWVLKVFYFKTSKIPSKYQALCYYWGLKVKPCCMILSLENSWIQIPSPLRIINQLKIILQISFLDILT